jgi:hypothetical protein
LTARIATMVVEDSMVVLDQLAQILGQGALLSCSSPVSWELMASRREF